MRSEYKDREQIFSKLAQDLSKKLTRYCQSGPAQLQKGLWDIVSDAAGMDAEMEKQRAVYWIYMPGVRPKLTFKGRVMVAALECPHTAREEMDTVGIVVRPMLFRRGTSSGEDYKRVSDLVESDVWLRDVDEKQTQIRADRSESRHGQKAEQSESRERTSGERSTGRPWTWGDRGLRRSSREGIASVGRRQ